MSSIPQVRKALAGNTGVQLSVIGLGCMSFSPFLPSLLTPDEGESLKVIESALEVGINLFNTADFYGAFHHNEKILAKAIKKYGRDKFFITNKFGMVRNEQGFPIGMDLSAANIRPSLEASLKALETDYLDAYYPARVDQKAPIEETIKVLAELKKEGKIRFLGLSEAGPETIRRAHAVHPIHFLEAELSLFSLHLRDEVLPILKELGISLLAYSPLSRGFLTGEIKKVEDLPNDGRARFPRFQPENFHYNLQLVDEITKMAKQRNVTISQFALAWVIAQGPNIFPIPGTKNSSRIYENVGAADIQLTSEELARIEDILSKFEVKGERYDEHGMSLCMK